MCLNNIFSEDTSGVDVELVVLVNPTEGKFALTEIGRAGTRHFFGDASGVVQGEEDELEHLASEMIGVATYFLGVVEVDEDDSAGDKFESIVMVGEKESLEISENVLFDIDNFLPTLLIAVICFSDVETLSENVRFSEHLDAETIGVDTSEDEFSQKFLASGVAALDEDELEMLSE
ncbi:hypothetical protein FF38_01231 [Lucilia cuprina]|uniref:Uncharacterized protein n=1 Tax=Lucilia cuprina TaxID=7375 RepID=A0A0L0BWT2_LUCCU|nr:hypothetical protein FF38_01231 [Lucilia cuprina]